VKTKFYLSVFLYFLVLILSVLSVKGQISGRIFRDINNDGVRQASNPTEPWEYGVTVRAYNAANGLIGTAVTNNTGSYTFSAAQAPDGLAVRLEFILNSGDQPSKRMGANRSNIQFVIAGASAINIDFAISSRKNFSNNANPYVATTAYTNGDPNSTGTHSAGDNDNLYVFPYDLSSDGGSTRRSANRHTGAVFGLAWQRESRTLLMAAYLKRHSGFGPGGIGAIYESQISSTGIPSTPAVLLDVTTIGINVGINPRTTSLPTDSRTPNTDDGVFAEVGKRGIGGIDLSVDGRDLYLVNMYEKKLHRINIGNPLKSSFSSADVTGTWVIPDPGVAGTVWHPMAVELYGGKVYVGGVTTKETVTAHTIADTVNLKGIVYEFDPATASFTEVLRFPLSYRRGFTNNDYRYADRNNFWSGWQNNGDISIGGPLRNGLIGSTTGGNATGIYYAQPMLCNIEFDADGAMIVGVRDRFGDQAGYANLFETGNGSGETYRGLTTGEVLKAGRNGAIWELEFGGSVTNNGIITTTPGLADNNPAMTGSFPLTTGTPWGGTYGPGGGYFYYNHNFSLTNVPSPFNTGSAVPYHYVKSNGGLAVYPGYNEVLMTAIDPENTSYANGIIKNFNSGSNAGNMSGRKELMRSNSNDPTNMGKAAALGDVEILLDAEAMEIGNRIWLDGNHNGRQDAHEPGITGVTVVLRSPGVDNAYNTADDQVWTVITDANGNYYFDNSIVNDNRRPVEWIGVSATNSGVLPGFEYKIEIAPAQTALAGIDLTSINGANDMIDSDGHLSAGVITYVFNSGGSTAAASSFTNNYDIDFGFYSIVLSVQKIDISAILNGNTTKVKWQTIEEENVAYYYVEKSEDGINFTTVTTTLSKGNGSFSYEITDDISRLNTGVLYYRIKAVDNTGATKYSPRASVSLTGAVQLVVSPNPFTETVSISISSLEKAKAELRLINLAGQVVFQKAASIEKGRNNIVLTEFSGIAKGTYFLDISIGQKRETQKLVKK
jgi:hypothetical protein